MEDGQNEIDISNFLELDDLIPGGNKILTKVE